MWLVDATDVGRATGLMCQDMHQRNGVVERFSGIVLAARENAQTVDKGTV